MAEDPAVTIFREYLRIRTEQPNPDYKPAIEFIKRQAQRIGIPISIYGTTAEPIAVLTWEGQNPLLPSILLNSHMDVVPVYKDKWSHDPFQAHKTEDGKIYGRGSQDMKSQGIEYLEAVSRLKKSGFKPLRTVHISFVPDEEIGSKDGMDAFVKMDEFKAMNVGFAIDESCACPLDFFILFFTERSGWALEVICSGPTGHGSTLPTNTASDKARIVIGEFLDRRTNEWLKIAGEKFPPLALAHVNTINLTKINGGVHTNVIPDEISVTFDIRVSVDEDHDKFFEWIQSVVKKAGDGVEIKFIQKDKKFETTKTDNSNPFWRAFKCGIEKTGIEVKPIACPGNTDGRFLRAVGVPTFGFSPLRKTPTLLHNHDEFLDEKQFLEAIDVFVEVIKSIASVA